METDWHAFGTSPSRDPVSGMPDCVPVDKEGKAEIPEEHGRVMAMTSSITFEKACLKRHLFESRGAYGVVSWFYGGRRSKSGSLIGSVTANEILIFHRRLQTYETWNV